MSAKKIQRALLQPFSADDLEFRIQSSGEHNNRIWARIVAYVNNRAIQQRLDDVVGAFNWKNEFKPLPNGSSSGALCGLSIKFNDEWVTKYDGADNTSIEATKGGLSNAQKRAAVEWGIGRYLYEVEAMYAICITVEDFKKLKQHEKDAYEKATTKNKKVFYWTAPKLDAKFLPKKHISKTVYETIEKLIIETKSNTAAICESYGIDDLKDLYSDEAGSLTTLLLRTKEKQNANEKN